MCWSSSSTTTATSTSVWMAAPVWSRDRLVLIWGVTISPLNGKSVKVSRIDDSPSFFYFSLSPPASLHLKEKKNTPKMTHLALRQPAAALSSVCKRMIYWLALEETLGLFLFSEIHYWFLWGEGTLREEILTWTKVIILHLLICFGRWSTRDGSETNRITIFCCLLLNHGRLVIFVKL